MRRPRFPRIGQSVLRKSLPALIVVAALSAGLAAAAPAKANDQIIPQVCVTYDPVSSEIFARWSYYSTFADTQFVDVGSDNFISPSPEDRDQTTFLKPGLNSNAWSTTFSTVESPAIAWNVLGNSATASVDSFDCNTPDSAPGQVPGSGAGVVGDPVVGQQLVAVTGGRDGFVESFDFKWQTETAPDVWNDVAGATHVSYTPAVDDVGKNLRVQVTAHSAGASQVLNIQASGPVQAGSAPPQSALVPSESALKFTRSARSEALDVTNSGATPLSVGGYVKTGANPNDFAASASDCGLLQPGHSCSVRVGFSPTASGSRRAALQLLDTSGVKSSPVALSGSTTRAGLTVRAAIRHGLKVHARRLHARW